MTGESPSPIIIYGDAELEREAVVAKNATTAADGKTYQVEYFNLDAIISVGYRVSSALDTLKGKLIAEKTENEVKEIVA